MEVKPVSKGKRSSLRESVRRTIVDKYGEPDERHEYSCNNVKFIDLHYIEHNLAFSWMIFEDSYILRKFTGEKLI